MTRPKMIVPCVADRYVHDKQRERIAEFSFPGTDGPAGGLISLRYRDEGPPLVDVYRVDGCEVHTKERAQLEDALREIERVLQDHPDAERGNAKVHYALAKARNALAKEAR